MRKRSFVCAYVLEALACAGAYVVRYFTHRKMGMARHMVYLNNKWRAALPLDALRIVLIAAVLSLAVWALAVLWRRKGATLRRTNMALTAFTAGVVLWYIVFHEAGQAREYYLVSLLLALAALAQSGACLLGTGRGERDKVGKTDETVVKTQTGDQVSEKKQSLAGKIVVLAVILAALAAYLAVPAARRAVNSLVDMFRTGDFEAMRSFIAKYGPWAMAVSFLLMIFQSVAAPLPAFFITLTNANLFGWWQGAILSWTSAMAGAAVCFYIARILGRDVVVKLCTAHALEQIDGFFDKYGRKSILVARLLPFISFDIVSYAAGLTSMDFWEFFLATGIGQLPATVVYSYVGGMLTGGARLLFTGLLCLFALAILVTIIRSIWVSRQKAKAADGQGKE